LSAAQDKAALRRAEGFIFDCDGDLAGPAAAAILELLARRQIPVVFLTEEMERSEEALASDFRAHGLRAEAEQIVTCGALIARELREPSQREPVCMIGDGPHRDNLAARGVRLAPRDSAVPAKILLIASTGGFSADELTLACAHIHAGGKFLATARQRFRQTGETRLLGPGALVRAIEHVTHRRAHTLGKPSRALARFALQRLGLAGENAVVVTDDFALGVPMARAAGCQSALILTDAARMIGTRKPRADATFDSLAELRAALS
jgi:4-nitrophenyl phosphatase